MSADFESQLMGLREQLAAVRGELEQARRENTLLRQKIDLLIRRVFGSSSEQMDPAQLELLLQLPEASAVVAEKSFPEKSIKPAEGSRRPAARVGRKACPWSKKSSSRSR